MLNKEVCRRCCINEDQRELGRELARTNKPLPSMQEFEAHFDICWDGEHFDCIGIYDQISITDDPPKTCPYILEQLLSKEGVNKGTAG